mmetsp:Transcript_50487/g.64701  ORF Transcript_50487/g.64701 Transcript_50487/m.64701 type:complete len:502 (+) Transcript_50487:99-1604(+)
MKLLDLLDSHILSRPFIEGGSQLLKLFFSLWFHYFNLSLQHLEHFLLDKIHFELDLYTIKLSLSPTSTLTSSSSTSTSTSDFLYNRPWKSSFEKVVKEIKSLTAYRIDDLLFHYETILIHNNLILNQSNNATNETIINSIPKFSFRFYSTIIRANISHTSSTSSSIETSTNEQEQPPSSVTTHWNHIKNILSKPPHNKLTSSTSSSTTSTIPPTSIVSKNHVNKEPLHVVHTNISFEGISTPKKVIRNRQIKQPHHEVYSDSSGSGGSSERNRQHNEFIESLQTPKGVTATNTFDQIELGQNDDECSQNMGRKKKKNSRLDLSGSSNLNVDKNTLEKQIIVFNCGHHHSRRYILEIADKLHSLSILPTFPSNTSSSSSLFPSATTQQDVAFDYLKWPLARSSSVSSSSSSSSSSTTTTTSNSKLSRGYPDYDYNSDISSSQHYYSLTEDEEENNQNYHSSSNFDDQTFFKLTTAQCRELSEEYKSSDLVSVTCPSCLGIKF